MIGSGTPKGASAAIQLAGFTPEEAQKILAAIAGLRFGSVEVVVHDGRIVQIERTEKVRLDSIGKRS
jgi:hypothetical protein